MSINELPQGFLASGSKVTQTQYLVMRVIQSEITNPDDLADKLAGFSVTLVWTNATNIVQASPACHDYLALIHNSKLVRDVPINNLSHPGFPYNPVQILV